jgi:hypothetical protein
MASANDSRLRIERRALPVTNGAPVRLRVERQLGYKHAKYVMRSSSSKALRISPAATVAIGKTRATSGTPESDESVSFFAPVRRSSRHHSLNRRPVMPQSSISKAALIAFVFVSFLSPVAAADQMEVAVPPSGIVKVKSDYSVAETIARIKKDVADKGIASFRRSINKSSPRMPASSCGLDAARIRQSAAWHAFRQCESARGTRLARARAGARDENGNVWAAYTDFGWIARRHDIKGTDLDSFNKASGVIASITSSVKAH